MSMLKSKVFAWLILIGGIATLTFKPSSHADDCPFERVSVASKDECGDFVLPCDFGGESDCDNGYWDIFLNTKKQYNVEGSLPTRAVVNGKRVCYVWCYCKYDKVNKICMLDLTTGDSVKVTEYKEESCLPTGTGTND